MLDILKRTFLIGERELRAFLSRPIFLICMIVAPLFFMILFTSMMNSGLPTKLPAAVVDEDNTHVTRGIVRILGSMQETEIVAHYNDFTSARKAMQRGEIYAIFRIPRGTTHAALTSRQPKISFYTNDSYYVAASLLMKDMRKLSELSGMAITRETLSAKGVNERAIMPILQPIVIESHPLGNPYLNYSVVLTNLLVPGIFMLVILITTSYVMGIEWKRGRQKELLDMAGGNALVAVWGKLLPQTMLYTLLMWFAQAIFYMYLDFPCECGIERMMLWGFMAVIASQGLGLFFFEVFVGEMRFAMSACSLWGVLSFSLAGFSFPVSAMQLPLQWLANLFPLHHYFLLYEAQALNGYPAMYEWKSILALLGFSLLPLLFLPRLKDGFLNKEYVP
ncbi:MAG: ABC transporter permease [Bacteroidaceae bacterium]|nr:ABC transporter permease [Bacteroidaceae bacterium]